MSIQPWQVINTKIIQRTPWIEVIEDTCQLQDGQTLTYTYTRRVDEGPMIMAEEADGSLWLVRQYRHPIKKTLWQFPAEGKFPDEDWQEAAARGLREELQLQASEWHDLGEFFPDPGGLQQKYHAFVARGLQKISKVAARHADGEPEIEVEELEINRFTRAEVDQLLANGELGDNWTLAGLYLLDRFHARKTA